MTLRNSFFFSAFLHFLFGTAALTVPVAMVSQGVKPFLIMMRSS